MLLKFRKALKSQLSPFAVCAGFAMLLTLLILGRPAQAAPACRDVFTTFTVKPRVKIETPESVLNSLYADSKVLGFATPDHDKHDTFTQLVKFVEEHGHDSELKSIAVELTTEMREFFEAASVTEPAETDLAALGKWRDYLTVSEPNFTLTQLLPVIRKINLSRPNDPILVVPVDSISQLGFWSTIKQSGETPASPPNVNPEKFEWAFMGSIDREIQTAKNYLSMVRSRWPGRKSLIVYQHAHLLRNLKAWGPTRASGKPQAIETKLSWADFAADRDATFSEDYRVALFDTRSAWNPEGVVDGDMYLAARTPRSAYAYKTNGPLSGAIKLTKSNFLTLYRSGTIRINDPSQSIADAVIWTD